jgi:hypothetical protein
MEDQCRTVADGGRLQEEWSRLLLLVSLRCLRWNCRWLSSGHAAEDLPACGCSEPGVGNAAGFGVAMPVPVFPGGGEPVVGYDNVAGCVAACGPDRIGPKAQTFCGVLIDPVSYVVFMLRGRTAVGPAEEVRVPQGSITDEVECFHAVPVGLFELPDGGLVGRFLGDGNAGTKGQQKGDIHSLHLQDGGSSRTD